jgi:hypothetical protein
MRVAGTDHRHDVRTGGGLEQHERRVGLASYSVVRFGKRRTHSGAATASSTTDHGATTVDGSNAARPCPSCR